MKRERARFWGAFAVAVVLALAGITAAARWHRLFPTGEVSELYLRYKDTPGVDATFIRGFQVNDTLALDVTLLQATDSARWERLITDFEIPNEFLTGKDDHVITRRAKKGHTDRQMDSVPENNDLILVADGMRTVSIFHITDNNQIHSILYKHYKELKK